MRIGKTINDFKNKRVYIMLSNFKSRLFKVKIIPRNLRKAKETIMRSESKDFNVGDVVRIKMAVIFSNIKIQ